MPPIDHEFRSELSTLQKDVAQVTALVPRLDATIEKLTEVSLNVSKLLAVHEQRLDQVDKASLQFAEMLERVREKNDDSHNDIYEEISKVRKELEDQITKSDDKIVNEIKALRTEIKTLTGGLSTRIGKLEKWIWMASGGAVVVGFIISALVNFFTKH